MTKRPVLRNGTPQGALEHARIRVGGHHMCPRGTHCPGAFFKRLGQGRDHLLRPRCFEQLNQPLELVRVDLLGLTKPIGQPFVFHRHRLHGRVVRVGGSVTALALRRCGGGNDVGGLVEEAADAHTVLVSQIVRGCGGGHFPTAQTTHPRHTVATLRRGTEKGQAEQLDECRTAKGTLRKRPLRENTLPRTARFGTRYAVEPVRGQAGRQAGKQDKKGQEG